jgi:hypothetical protein
LWQSDKFRFKSKLKSSGFKNILNIKCKAIFKIGRKKMDKLIMSEKERKQLAVFEKLKLGYINQIQASKILNTSARWVRKKYKRYLANGDAGLVHQNRGRPSVKKVKQEDIDELVRLLNGEWKGFGPTFAAQKFEKLSKETVRKIMINEGFWKSKRRKFKHRQRRPRREVVGMMTQLDGSPHDWFEGRGSFCTLLVFIDDATSQLLWLEFAPSESFESVGKATKQYLKKHGTPASVYVDYGSVFSVNTNNPDREKLSQWERAMAELGITVIHARSPQAKGRVERANKTLQDRLVKEMRLAGISSIEEANAYIQEGDYIQQHNDRFAVTPEKVGNAHLPVETKSLDNILCRKESRVVTNDFTISYRGKILQLEKGLPAVVRPKSSVLVLQHLDSSISLYARRTRLNYTIIGCKKKSKLSPVEHVNQESRPEGATM